MLHTVFYKMVNRIIVRKKCSFFRKLFLTLIILVTLISVQGQRLVTLDEAIEFALEHHPRVRNASAAVDKIRMSKGENLDIPAISVSYAWGQINSEVRKDNQLDIIQSLGSLITPFYRNVLVNREIQTGEYYKQMVRKEIIAEVKRAWTYYLYALQTFELYREYSEWVEHLQKAGNLRYEQGNITLLEKNMATSLVADLRMKQMQAEEELRIATRRFTWVCYADNTITPVETALLVWPVSTGTSLLSDAHQGYFHSQTEEKKAAVSLEKSRFFPEFSVGYTRQKISPLNGLDSWMVSVSFPLWFVPGKSRVKQAKIEYHIARLEADSQSHELANKVTELQAHLRQQGETLHYYITAALAEADALLQSSLIQFYESDTDINHFVQSLNTVRDIRKGYIEAIYDYNVSVLELELYTDNQ